MWLVSISPKAQKDIDTSIFKSNSKLCQYIIPSLQSTSNIFHNGCNKLGRLLFPFKCQHSSTWTILWSSSMPKAQILQERFSKRFPSLCDSRVGQWVSFLELFWKSDKGRMWCISGLKENASCWGCSRISRTCSMWWCLKLRTCRAHNLSGLLHNLWVNDSDSFFN